MEVSLEIVPRNRESILSGARAAAAHPRIGIINIPDLLRFPVRSWEACGMLRSGPRGAGTQDAESRVTLSSSAAGSHALIPHLRAIDFDLSKPFPHRALFEEQGITRVLVIAGDPPADPSQPVYPTGTCAFIEKLKAEMPELRIYAAFDPYRSNIRFELDYLRQKEDAGAEAFMSQPFFDLRLLEIYAEYLEGKNVFWGIAPVLSEASRSYWESRNRAVFPKRFKADLFWNVDFGRRVLHFCEENSFNLYLMPIKVDLSAYLSGIFS